MKKIAMLLSWIGIIIGPSVVGAGATRVESPAWGSAAVAVVPRLYEPEVVRWRAAVARIEADEAAEEAERAAERAGVLVVGGVVYRHGDISWLPVLAAEAGWPEEAWEKLGQVILRESGGCPNRRGGDAVDEDCNITRVTEWNHRSDTGLLQINGVNYDTERNPWARVCLDMGVCEQGPLLDPVTNLRAGKLLYDLAGWAPWDPCAARLRPRCPGRP
jgi:hypothetical protein